MPTEGLRKAVFASEKIRAPLLGANNAGKTTPF